MVPHNRVRAGAAARALGHGQIHVWCVGLHRHMDALRYCTGIANMWVSAATARRDELGGCTCENYTRQPCILSRQHLKSLVRWSWLYPCSPLFTLHISHCAHCGMFCRMQASGCLACAPPRCCYPPLILAALGTFLLGYVPEMMCLCTFAVPRLPTHAFAVAPFRT